MFVSVDGYGLYKHVFVGRVLDSMLNYLLGKKPTLRTCSLTDCGDEFVCAYNSGDVRRIQPLLLPFSEKKI
jgi:hypothetical protein